MLKRLTETTRRCLHEVEGDLWVPWAAAQQINAQQKVNFSIKFVSRSFFDREVVSEYFSPPARASKARVFPLGYLCVGLTIDLEYWINLGKSTVFKGQVLLDCLSRIHLDIIEVWNFYDPEVVSSNH
jgi:hypothetical protein